MRQNKILEQQKELIQKAQEALQGKEERGLSEEEQRLIALYIQLCEAKFYLSGSRTLEDKNSVKTSFPFPLPLEIDVEEKINEVAARLCRLAEESGD